MTQKVYVILTNNGNRKPEQADAANPRADNHFGHIIEMIPPDGDHAAAQFRWEMLVKCGDPSVAEVGATFSTDTTRNGWFGMPDNLAVRQPGTAVDRDRRQFEQARTGRADGLWGVETEGPAARHVAAFLSRAGRRRIVRAVLHARRRNAVRRRAASRPKRILGRAVDVRGAGDALARLQARHAAAPVGGRHHQTRRRQDRVLAFSVLPGERFGRAGGREPGFAQLAPSAVSLFSGASSSYTRPAGSYLNLTSP